MIGLFGGSFDPIHHGHLLVGQAACEALGLTELRFMPANVQPFKAGRHGATPEHRAAMVGAALAGSERFRLERIELERPGPSYSVDTLRALHAREPGSSFALLIGADAVQGLPGWREAEALPGLCRVVAFARAGVPTVESALVDEWIGVPALELSATVIRERVRTGRSIRYWVPDSVASYVATHGLYRDGAG